MSRFSLALAASLSAGIALASPAHAAPASQESRTNQPSEADQGSTERINQVIVYGDDPCPKSTAEEITVCARKSESERYRIPEILRESDSPKNEAWSNRVVAYEMVGKTGTLSCSPVGPGGSTGCLSKLIDTAYAEKGTDPSLHFSELIAEERAKRLANIDEQAAETQERVEKEERAYAKKQADEEKKEDAAKAAPQPEASTAAGQ